MQTPSHIDAARSGSVGGKHSKGKGTGENVNTIPVQNKKIQRDAAPVTTLQEFVGAIRPAIQTSCVDSRASLHRREAMALFPESIVRNRMPQLGQVENMSIRRL